MLNEVLGWSWSWSWGTGITHMKRFVCVVFQNFYIYSKKFTLFIFTMKNLLWLYLFVALSSASSPEKIYHAYWFSDLHLDNHYEEGAPDKCWIGTSSGMKCCRAYDIPVKGSHKASRWGDYSCDTPKLLLHTMMDVTKTLLFPDFPPSLIIQTGDLVDHHDVAQDFPHNMHEVDECTNAFRLLGLKQEVPVVMVIGNHDTWPVDQLGTPEPEKDGSTKLTRHLWSVWSSFEPFASFDSAKHQDFLKGGYYSFDLFDKIHIIVTNSLYDDDHNILIGKIANPVNQTSWLEESIQQAAKDNKTIWLMGHIPPGNGEADRRYTDLLINLTSTYPIQNQFFGHTHLDSFTLYPTNNYAMIMPSVLPENHDPAVRILSFYANGSLVDWTTYALSFDALIQNDTIQLKKVWTASTVLGSSLNVSEWYTKALTNDSIVQDFWYWHHVGNPPRASMEEMRSTLQAIKL